ncbi:MULTISPECIES: DUF192 domain-containing protein [unclassified Thioalkalivibrio]|uniref:DUF192 domain-containing protein n=1 Tax=unclassified Thioalkalivibrio TaxID=2621013 RepID=UPI0003744355|nr:MULTISPECIES: DUF192 domain-containing protein [unclassified Thioalkalivibrio]
MTASPWAWGRALPGLAGLLLLVLGASLAHGEQGLPTSEVNVGEQTLSIEIAATERSRRIGLMHRDHLPEDHGMLFIWPRAAQYGMWMQNTRIPLDVAFIDADFTITNIASMTPHSTRIHEAKRPVPYALEVNAGWFAMHGVEAGDRVPDLGRLVGGND